MMKRTLVLLSALVLSVGAFAQNFTATWEKYEAPEFMTSVPDLDTEFYMWSVGNGGFYTHHRGENATPYWQTRAAVSDTIGALVKLSQTNPESESQWDLDELGSSVHLLSYVTKNSDYYCTFVAASGGPVWDGVWTDNNEETYVVFDIEDQGSGQFKIKLNIELVAPSYASDFDAPYLVVADLSDNTSGSTIATESNLVYLWDSDTLTTLGYSYSDVYDTWAAVDTATYNSYIEVAAAHNACYLAALSLKAAIEAAIESNPTIDLSEQIAVYNNTSSTLEELEDAEASISQAIIDLWKDVATADEPVDFTSALTNPDFSTGDDTGWSYDSDLATPTVDATYLNCEVWNDNFNVYQELTDLPEGVYRVDIQAFYRAGDDETDNTYYIADPTKYNYSKLYAESAVLGTTQQKSVKRIQEEAQDAPLLGDVDDADTWPYDSETEDADGNTVYTPNSMQGSQVWFEAGYYWNSLFFAIAESDTMLVGFKKETLIDYDWTIFDNFQLYYYGDADDAYEVWADSTSAELSTMYDLSDTYHGAPEAELYNSLIEELSTATTKESILAAQATTTDVTDSLDLSITNYATYVSLCETIEAWLEENSTSEFYDFDTDLMSSLTEYLQTYAEDSEDGEEAYGWPNGNMHKILNVDDNDNPTYEGILSAAEIAAETEYLQALYTEAVADALKEGGDVTGLLTNADFATNDLTGWTYDEDYGTPSVSYWECEMWNSNFDLYQELSGLPEGVYQLEVQAFYREGGYDDAYELWAADEENITTEIYLNDYSTPVVSIFEDRQSTNIYSDASYASPDGSTYIPDNMYAAYIAFTTYGLYDENSLYAIVGEDGELKVGIRNLDYTSYCWAIFDNFRLTYWGKDAEKVYLFLQELMETALDLMEEDMGATELAALEAEYDTAKDAVSSADGDTMYDCILSLSAAITTAEESIAAYEELADALEELVDAIETYADEASAEAYDAADQLYSDVEETLQNLDKTTAEVEELIEEIAAAIGALKIPAEYEDASDDNPVDFTSVIVNADFSEGDDTGWEGDPTVSSSYYNAECYNTTFDVYQDIYSLPSGTYEVRVNAFHRVGTYQNDWDLYEDDPDDEDDNLTAYLYAVNGDNEVATKVMHMSVGALAGDDTYSDVYAEADDGTYMYVPNTMEVGEAYMHLTDDEGNDLNVYQNSLYIDVDADVSSTLRIGLKAESVVSTAWVLFDDWQLFYYGTESELAIGSVASGSNSAQTVVGIYSLSGARLNSYQQGVNIVKMVDADGNVSAVKVLVK